MNDFMSKHYNKIFKSFINSYNQFIYPKMNEKVYSVENKALIDQNGNNWLTLRNNIQKKSEKNINKILKTLLKEEWVLDMGVYSNLNMKNFCSNILETKSIKIWLSYNANQNILKEIENIGFPCIRQLSLANNRIASLESIAFLNFPKLEQIQLRENVVRSIQPLKKLKLPQLKVFSLYKNLVLDLAPFTAVAAKGLQSIWLQYQNDQPVQGQSIGWLSKLQSSSVRGVAATTANRLKETHQQISLHKKFLNLKIYRSLK